MQKRLLENLRKNLKRWGWEDTSKEEIRFFYPYWFFLQYPFRLIDVKKAVSFLEIFLYSPQEVRITLYADKDVDGVLSSSMFYRFLLEKGVHPSHIYVLFPSEEDRYGITPEVVEKISSFPSDLLILLDVGTNQKKEVEKLLSTFSHVILIDHHKFLLKEEIPDVLSFINPYREENGLFFRELSTTGLLYMLLWSLEYKRRKKRKVSFSEALWREYTRKIPALYRLNRSSYPISYEEKRRILFFLQHIDIYKDLLPYMVLAGLGGVADVMPLWGENRILVCEMVRNFSVLENFSPGIMALLREEGIEEESPSLEDLQYSLIPSLNAGGRMENPQVSFQVVVEKEPLEAYKGVKRLQDLLEKRRRLSRAFFSSLESSPLKENEKIYIGYQKGLPRGITGLLASQMAKKKGKPALLLAEDGEYLKGSIRASSFKEDVHDFLEKLAPFLEEKGGHQYAGGFSLKKEKKESFLQEVDRLLKRYSWKKEGKSFHPFGDPLEYSLKEFSLSLWKKILPFAPFGEGNPPVYLRIQVESPPRVTYFSSSYVEFFFPEENPQIYFFWFFPDQDPREISLPCYIHVEMGEKIGRLRVKEVELGEVL